MAKPKQESRGTWPLDASRASVLPENVGDRVRRRQRCASGSMSGCVLPERAWRGICDSTFHGMQRLQQRCLLRLRTRAKCGDLHGWMRMICGTVRTVGLHCRDQSHPLTNSTSARLVHRPRALSADTRGRTDPARPAVWYLASSHGPHGHVRAQCEAPTQVKAHRVLSALAACLIELSRAKRFVLCPGSLTLVRRSCHRPSRRLSSGRHSTRPAR